MPLCNNCQFYNAEYDEELQQWDDTIKVGDETVLHHCPLYDDHIPNGIFYGLDDCKYYEPKKAT